jgi:hypothetical protein
MVVPDLWQPVTNNGIFLFGMSDIRFNIKVRPFKTMVTLNCKNFHDTECKPQFDLTGNNSGTFDLGHFSFQYFSA